MRTRSRIPRSPHAGRGFSLVELMIAMTIGLILVGAVAYLFLGTRQTFRTTDNMSRIQENARYALDTMARDVRMAGYIGCGNLENITVNTIANPPVPALSLANAVTGLDAGSGATTFGGITRPAGDAITITGAFGGGVYLDGNLIPANANIQLQCDPDANPQCNPYDFVAGEVLIVTNCTTADVFRATNVSNSGSITTIAHGNSTNTGNRIGTYGEDAFVIRLQQYTYFIGTNPAGRRSLYRTSFSEGTVELVEDVQDMQILYGVNTDGVEGADSYVAAAAVGNWSQVVSVRINLLLASPENGVVPTAQTYNFNGAAVTATDRRMYQVFTTTVGVRNRLQ